MSRLSRISYRFVIGLIHSKTLEWSDNWSFITLELKNFKIPFVFFNSLHSKQSLILLRIISSFPDRSAVILQIWNHVVKSGYGRGHFEMSFSSGLQSSTGNYNLQCDLRDFCLNYPFQLCIRLFGCLLRKSQLKISINCVNLSIHFWAGDKTIILVENFSRV